MSYTILQVETAVREATVPLHAEIERLTKERDDNDDNARHNYKEVLRLRAALEQFAELDTHISAEVRWIAYKAREALRPGEELRSEAPKGEKP